MHAYMRWHSTQSNGKQRQNNGSENYNGHWRHVPATNMAKEKAEFYSFLFANLLCWNTFCIVNRTIMLIKCYCFILHILFDEVPFDLSSLLSHVTLRGKCHLGTAGRLWLRSSFVREFSDHHHCLEFYIFNNKYPAMIWSEQRKFTAHNMRCRRH